MAASVLLTVLLSFDSVFLWLKDEIWCLEHLAVTWDAQVLVLLYFFELSQTSSETSLCSRLKGWQPFILSDLFELSGIWTVCFYRAYLDVILTWQLCAPIIIPVTVVHVFPSFELQHSGFFCLFLLASQTFKRRRVLWAVFSCMVCAEPSDQVSQDPVWNPS